MIPTTPAVVKAATTDYNHSNNNSSNENQFVNMCEGTNGQMGWRSFGTLNKPPTISSCSGNYRVR